MAKAALKKKMAPPAPPGSVVKRTKAARQESAADFEAFAARRARTAQVVTRKIERLLRTGR